MCSKRLFWKRLAIKYMCDLNFFIIKFLELFEYQFWHCFYYSFLFYDLEIKIFLLKQILFITNYFCLDAYILMTENVENDKTFGELKSKYEIKWQKVQIAAKEFEMLLRMKPAPEP